MIFIPIRLENNFSLPDLLIVVPGVIYKTLFIFITGRQSVQMHACCRCPVSFPYSCLTYPVRLFYCIMRSLIFAPLPGPGCL